MSSPNTGLLWSSPTANDLERHPKHYDHLVVFGDSYSARATTWAGQLKKLAPSVAVVENYARDGHTAEYDLSSQLSRYFVKSNLQASPDTSPPTRATVSNEALYVLWLGINDCGSLEDFEIEAAVETVLEAIHELYVKASARHFLLIDLPPLERFPVGRSFAAEGIQISDRYSTWNENLLAQAKVFAEETPRASIYMLSSHQILSELLDHPHRFGFRSPDSETSSDTGSNSSAGESDAEDNAGGRIVLADVWEDDLHLTREVHTFFANRLISALGLKLCSSTGAFAAS